MANVLLQMFEATIFWTSSYNFFGDMTSFFEAYSWRRYKFF